MCLCESFSSFQNENTILWNPIYVCMFCFILIRITNLFTSHSYLQMLFIENETKRQTTFQFFPNLDNVTYIFAFIHSFELGIFTVSCLGNFSFGIWTIQHLVTIRYIQCAGNSSISLFHSLSRPLSISSVSLPLHLLPISISDCNPLITLSKKRILFCCCVSFGLNFKNVLWIANSFFCWLWCVVVCRMSYVACIHCHWQKYMVWMLVRIEYHQTNRKNCYHIRRTSNSDECDTLKRQKATKLNWKSTNVSY